MKAKITTMLGVVLALLLAELAAYANDAPIIGVWTAGGRSNYLVDTANWEGGVVPGRVSSVDGTSTNGSWGSTMIFNGSHVSGYGSFKTAADATHGSLVSTWKMIFRGANLVGYNFAAYQTLRIEAGGGIYVEEDAGNVPYFATNGEFCIFNASEETHTVTIRNDSTLAPFVFYNVNNARGMRAAGWTGNPVLKLEGKGNIKFARSIWENSGSYILEIAQEESGATIFDSGTEQIYPNSIIVQESATVRTIRIESGTTVATRIVGGKSARPLVVSNDCQIVGGGTLYFGRNLVGGSSIWIAPGKTLNLDVNRVKNYGVDNNSEMHMYVLGGGSMVVGPNVTNLITGAMSVEEGSSLQVSSIGVVGGVSPLGTGSEIILKGGSSFVYAGTGENSDRELIFSTGGGSFVHSGAGNLVLGDVTTSANSSIVVSNNVTLTLASLSRSAGKLDVRTSGSGKVVVNSGLAYGRAPEWLTFNGKKAFVGQDGMLKGPGGLTICFR